MGRKQTTGAGERAQLGIRAERFGVECDGAYDMVH